MQTTLSDKKFCNDIIKYVRKIMTAYTELEALPNELLSDWKQRKKVKNKKIQLQLEIVRAQTMLRKKIDSMIIEI